MGDTVHNKDAENEDAVKTLKSLLKADDISEDEAQLQKAQKENDKEDKDEDKDEDDYNESYMKKYMKKFMKNNPDYFKKMGDMKKAVDYAYENADSDMEADATLIDGTEMFKAFKEMGDSFVKALVNFDERIQRLEDEVVSGNEIVSASGEVLIKAVEVLDQISNQPNPVKSKLADESKLQKAVGSEDAGQLNYGTAKKLLMKAAIDNGNAEAGKILTQVESCFGNFGLLPEESKKFIANLATVE